MLQFAASNLLGVNKGIQFRVIWRMVLVPHTDLGLQRLFFCVHEQFDFSLFLVSNPVIRCFGAVCVSIKK
jgi:hypothetical protein